MGQYFAPSSGGITVVPTDRQSGPQAGAGASGNRDLFLGADAGKNSVNSDIIALGNLAADAGINDAARLTSGIIVIGSNAAGAVTGGGTGGSTGGLIVIGKNALGSAVFAGSSVIIGNDAVASAVPVTGTPLKRTVVIGDQACQNITNNGVDGAVDSSVVIGYQAGKPSTVTKTITTSVVIGALACGNFTSSGGNGLVNVVAIGFQAGQNFNPSSLDGATLIGASAGQGLTGTAVGDIVLIGRAAGANIGDCGTQAIGLGATCAPRGSGSIAIGFGAAIAAGSTDAILIGENGVGGGADSIYIGQGNHVLTGVRNICLGSVSGNGETATNTDRFIVETFLGATRRTLLYGNLNDGYLIVGGSTPGGTRNIRGTTQPTNALALLNGTPGAGLNPTSGGFFYAAAGALHWFGSAGTDTVVAPA